MYPRGGHHSFGSVSIYKDSISRYSGLHLLDFTNVHILVLAPQPFYQERGTPIAVRLLVEGLLRRAGYQVDLLTYREGEPVEIDGLHHKRIKVPDWLRGVRPGVSFKKLCCDVIMLFTAQRMIRSAKRAGTPYQLVHAVEESVFMALVLKWLHRLPYIYDMDSLLSQQLVEKWRALRALAPLFTLFERYVLRRSLAVVAVCDSLADAARSQGAPEVHLLKDVSLLQPLSSGEVPATLRNERRIPGEAPLLLYIGNLEPYQGIELLVRAHHELSHHSSSLATLAHLVVIGGTADQIAGYSSLAKTLGTSARVHFLGPRPIQSLAELLAQADVLVSPRTQGSNTPMKIYSYLHSGVPLMATALPTHTQVLHPSVACLAPATPVEFGRALGDLLADPVRRAAIGKQARQLAEREYTVEAFHRRLSSIYDQIEASVTPDSLNARSGGNSSQFAVAP